MKRMATVAAWVLVFAVPGLISDAAFGQSATYPVTIKNSCDRNLFIRGASASDYLPGDQNGTWIDMNSSLTIHVPLPFSGGRIYGCWDDTIKDLDILNKNNGFLMQQHCGFAEFSAANNTSGNGNLFSDISFVDTFSNMPLRIEAPGGTDCSNSGVAMAYFTTAEDGDGIQWIGTDNVTRECPTGVLTNGEFKVCLSANMYCSDATYGDPSDPLCSKLDGIIEQCAAQYTDCAPAQNSTTVNVYGCSGSFFSGPGAGEKYCTAINRGILDSADNQTAEQFYPAGGIFNDYAAFAHAVIGPIFAISYDDYPSQLNQGGYVNCRESTQFTVEFCPDPGSQVYSRLGENARSRKLDTDVFRFFGKKGEEVSLRLKKVLSPAREEAFEDSGEAALVLMGPFTSPFFQKTVSGRLPLRIQRALPYTGYYRVIVHNNLGRHKPFAGNYGLRLQSSRRAWETLKPTRSVE
jgi:hypothetical protein